MGEDDAYYSYFTDPTFESYLNSNGQDTFPFLFSDDFLRDAYYFGGATLFESIGVSNEELLGQEEESSTTSSSTTTQGHIGRNVYRFDHDVICHVPLFLPSTNSDTTNHGHTDEYDDYANDATVESAAGAIMAMHHWNERNAVLIRTDSIHNNNNSPTSTPFTTSCPIRFTTEIFNTNSSPYQAIRGLTEMMLRNTDPARMFYQPQPCATIGVTTQSHPIRSSSSSVNNNDQLSHGHSSEVIASSLASTAGVYDIPYVSISTTSSPYLQSTFTSNTLSEEQHTQPQNDYPTYSSMQTSSRGDIRTLLDFVRYRTGSTYYGFVYTDDRNGFHLMNIVKDYASQLGMQGLSLPLSNVHLASLQPIKDATLEIDYIIASIQTNEYEQLMKAAAELGIQDKTWILTGPVTEMFQQSSSAGKDHAQSFTKSLPSENVLVLRQGANLGRHESFQREWDRFASQEAGKEVLETREPFNGAVVSKLGDLAMYSYDSVMAIGIAACNSWSNDSDGDADVDDTLEVFSGSHHHENLIQTSFEGVSGNVTLGPTYSSRNESSSFYTLYEVVPSMDNSDAGTNSQEPMWMEPKYSYIPSENSWFYGTGTAGSANPSEMTYYANANSTLLYMKYISTGARILAILLGCLAILSSIVFIVFTLRHHTKKAIRLSQPSFLIMICIGSLLMSCSIFPMTLDDGIDSIGQNGLDTACSSIPWLLSLGFITTFSALFSKLWRVNQLNEATLERRIVKITVLDAAIPLLVLLAINFIILITWDRVSPLEWKRIVLNTDYFGNPKEVVGFCTSDHAEPYLFALIAVDIFALLLACYQAYKARDVDTVLSESSYVAVAMLSIFQTLLFSVPMLVLTRESPSAYLLIYSSAVCLLAVVPILFIFVPKWYRLDTASNGENKNSVPSISAGTSHQRQSLVMNAEEIRSSVVKEEKADEISDGPDEVRYDDGSCEEDEKEKWQHDSSSIYSEETLDKGERFESDLSFAREGESLCSEDDHGPEILDKDSTISFAALECIEVRNVAKSSLMSFDDEDDEERNLHE